MCHHNLLCECSLLKRSFSWGYLLQPWPDRSSLRSDNLYSTYHRLGKSTFPALSRNHVRRLPNLFPTFPLHVRARPVANRLASHWPPAPDRTFKAAQLGCRVKGGLELIRQLYHDESVKNILTHEIMPHTAVLASELVRRQGDADR